MVGLSDRGHALQLFDQAVLGDEQTRWVLGGRVLVGSVLEVQPLGIRRDRDRVVQCVCVGLDQNHPLPTKINNTTYTET